MKNSDKDAMRKKDHIQLALSSQTQYCDPRFIYEPMISAHPNHTDGIKTEFLGKTLNAPIWVSSMTGGTQMAATINERLAKTCHKFGLGFALGSCRKLLDENTYFSDFDVRKYLGSELPFYANLGIAQLEQLIENNEIEKIDNLISKLDVDGIVVHVNPLQEWIQPEGDRFHRPAIETVTEFLRLRPSLNVIVKEVGQGMGPESLRQLMMLPLAAIEFGAYGGTNFSLLEAKRSKHESYLTEFAALGHSAEEMLSFIQKIVSEGHKIQCDSFIISGGVKTFLDGHYFMERLGYGNRIYGQAGVFLQYATKSQEDLDEFVQHQINGLAMARRFLKVRSRSLEDK